VDSHKKFQWHNSHYKKKHFLYKKMNPDEAWTHFLDEALLATANLHQAYLRLKETGALEPNSDSETESHASSPVSQTASNNCPKAPTKTMTVTSEKGAEVQFKHSPILTRQNNIWKTNDELFDFDAECVHCGNEHAPGNCDLPYP